MKNFYFRPLLGAAIIIVALAILVCAVRTDKPEEVAKDISVMVGKIVPSIPFTK